VKLTKHYCFDNARRRWSDCGIGSKVVAAFVFGKYGKAQTFAFGDRQTCYWTYKVCPKAPAQWVGRPIIPPWHETQFNKTTCFEGAKIRLRQCGLNAVIVAAYHNKLDEKDSETFSACSEDNCPRPCIFTTWKPYSQCSVTCGTCATVPMYFPVILLAGKGYMIRSRAVLISAHNGGKCGAKKHIRRCNMGPCPVNCIVSDWGKYTGCNKPCGVGRRVRTRMVLHRGSQQNVVCPFLVQRAECQKRYCPSNCQVCGYLYSCREEYSVHNR
jgi:hypothetical protein